MAPNRLPAALLLGLVAAGPPAADVPTTLAGATVLADAAGAKAWIAAHHPAIVDVSPSPRRPPVTPAGLPWSPPAHQDIPGSHWLPDAGTALLTLAGADAYRRAIAAIAGPPPGPPILAYCHPHCRASWNAANFLVQAGYTRVAWYPGGIEGWAAADYDLQRTQPVPY